jgi:hypothetical protein
MAKKKKNDNLVDGGFFNKDDSVKLDELIDITNEEINRDKLKSANEISLFGEQIINEISKKKDRFGKLKEKRIKWIMKKSNSYFYDELDSLTYHDVNLIYMEIKNNNKNRIKKFFEFIFNS